MRYPGTCSRRNGRFIVETRGSPSATASATVAPRAIVRTVCARGGAQVSLGQAKGCATTAMSSNGATAVVNAPGVYSTNPRLESVKRTPLRAWVLKARPKRPRILTLARTWLQMMMGKNRVLSEECLDDSTVRARKRIAGAAYGPLLTAKMPDQSCRRICA